MRIFPLKFFRSKCHSEPFGLWFKLTKRNEISDKGFAGLKLAKNLLAFSPALYKEFFAYSDTGV
ncbi:MAG: hypothetical protein HQ536_03190 [Parcubacteria group bacterium]|nr:hypothetical protein [Parcubacteria group bacterium]